MSMLLHACCGPCSMYPLELLGTMGKDLDVFWFNPNIQPQFEWDRRYDNLVKAADHYNVRLIRQGEGCEEEYWRSSEYLKEFSSRCEMCYDVRMDAVAKAAMEGGYTSFSTTLLVSPYQQHYRIAQIASSKADKYGVRFEYMDFRPGFRHGQDLAREIGLYRQKYCGCIFSLEESKFYDKIVRSFEPPEL